MTDQELLNILIKKGSLSEEAATSSLRDAELSGKSVEDVLYEKNLGGEQIIAQAKGELLGIGYKKIDVSSIPEDLLSLISKETSENYHVIPVSKDGNTLMIGMLHPDDVKAQDALKFIAKRERLNIGVYIITPSDLAAMARRYTPFRSEIDKAVEEMGVKAGEAAEKAVSLDEGLDKSESAPVIKIVASALKQAVEGGASDIHIEPQRLRLRIRFRIDGDLEEVASLPAALIQPVTSRVKVLSKLKLDETRVPQDGRFRALINNKEIDFRVATFPTPSGEKIVLRVLDPSNGLKDFNKMGFSSHNSKIFEEALEKPFGMILVTGPTGSGKSTSLYAVLQKLNTIDVNIVSLEDPVEYVTEGINQSQVQPEIGYTFASGLRQILRQDPDVILVGEIRDSETATLAANAALTGHVVLSTLHTNNAVGVVPRLLDLGVPAFLMPAALNLILAQRLVVRICTECREVSKASSDAENIISNAINNLPKDFKAEISSKFKPPYSIFHADNPKADCKKCKGKGIAGRVAVHEIFRMTRELGDIIMGGFSGSKLLDEAKRQGMVTMRQDGIIKALQGDVLFEEVVRETAE